MATDCIPQLSFKFDKRVVVKFDAAHASSDGGAVLLKAIDRQLGVTETVARGLRDRRQAGKIEHELLELVRQRVFGLVCGYADCNDAARLRGDAVHKFFLDRDPITVASAPGGVLEGRCLRMADYVRGRPPRWAPAAAAC